MNRVFTDHYFNFLRNLNTSLIPYNLRLSESSSSPRTMAVFMITPLYLIFFSKYLEGFLYGKLSVLCASTCALLLVAKKVYLFPGLGIYSGIFIVYLQISSNKSSTANFVFNILCLLCLLYVLSTSIFVIDLIVFVIYVVSNNLKSICNNIVFIISCAVEYQ